MVSDSKHQKVYCKDAPPFQHCSRYPSNTLFLYRLFNGMHWEFVFVTATATPLSTSCLTLTQQCMRNKCNCLETTIAPTHFLQLHPRATVIRRKRQVCRKGRVPSLCITIPTGLSCYIIIIINISSEIAQNYSLIALVAGKHTCDCGAIKKSRNYSSAGL